MGREILRLRMLAIGAVLTVRVTASGRSWSSPSSS